MRVGAFRMCVSKIHHVFWRCRSPIDFKFYLHNIFETLKNIRILEKHIPKNMKNVKLNNKKSKAVKICFFMAFLYVENHAIVAWFNDSLSDVRMT